MPHGQGRDLVTDPVICCQNRHFYRGLLGISEFNFFLFTYFVDPLKIHLLEFFKKISMYRSRDI